MPNDSATSSRMALPLLVSGQAQKELTHNEALLLIDMALMPLVESVGLNAPPTAPQIGQCWIVGPLPTGAWSGAANHLAAWTAGGWRTMALPQRADVRERVSGRNWTLGPAGWAAAPTWTAVSGGSTVDQEARAALESLAGMLAARGLLTVGG
jgi:hypothetical protein